MTWSLTRLLRWLGKNRTPKGHFQRSALGAPYEAHHKRYNTPHAAPAKDSGLHYHPAASASISHDAHAPDTSTNLFNAESTEQLTPHLLFKNTLLQKEKNTMQYKRLTVSSNLLHNFQPIRKTNKSPTTGHFLLLLVGEKVMFYIEVKMCF